MPRDSARPPFPGVRSPFVASPALELEGEPSLQKKQEVEQREQPVPRLLLHLGHSPDPNQRVQHEQQPGGQGVEQDQSLHAGPRALPAAPRPPPPACAPRAPSGAPEPARGRERDSSRPAAAAVPPQPPEPGRTGDSGSPLPQTS